jgi:hypothetical protein
MDAREGRMAKRKTMSDYRELVRRLRGGQSIRAIQRETGTHRKIVRGIRDLARTEGWLAEDRKLPSEAELQSALGRGGSRGDQDADAGATSRKPHALDSVKCGRRDVVAGLGNVTGQGLVLFEGEARESVATTRSSRANRIFTCT